MKFLLCYIISYLFVMMFYGQSKIVVYNPSGDLTRICPTLDSAYSVSVPGDFIYLPGGSFSLQTPIRKKIFIFGAGHHPDSSITTARTLITGSIVLEQGSDGGLITGCYFAGGELRYNFAQIYFNSDINDYNISRCYISGGISGNALFVQKNITISENIVGYYSLCFTCSNYYSVNFSTNSSNITLANNIFLSKISIHNSLLKNSISLWTLPYPLASRNSIIENNIFQIFAGIDSQNSFFYNNINGGVNGSNGTDGNGNQGSNNSIIMDPIYSLFVGYNSNNGWSYSSNFQLRPNSPYLNSGSDGTQVGIYGSLIPWKEGSIPANPHISFKDIPLQNNAAGILNVTIKVKAQSY